MKKLSVAVAAVIAIVGAFAFKANSSRIAGVYYIKPSNSVCTQLFSSIPSQLSTTTGSNPAAVVEIAGSQIQLYSESTCGTQLYFRP